MADNMSRKRQDYRAVWSLQSASLGFLECTAHMKYSPTQSELVQIPSLEPIFVKIYSNLTQAPYNLLFDCLVSHCGRKSKNQNRCFLRALLLFSQKDLSCGVSTPDNEIFDSGSKSLIKVVRTYTFGSTEPWGQRNFSPILKLSLTADLTTLYPWLFCGFWQYAFFLSKNISETFRNAAGFALVGSRSFAFFRVLTR